MKESLFVYSMCQSWDNGEIEAKEMTFFIKFFLQLFPMVDEMNLSKAS